MQSKQVNTFKMRSISGLYQLVAFRNLPKNKLLICIYYTYYSHIKRMKNGNFLFRGVCFMLDEIIKRQCCSSGSKTFFIFCDSTFYYQDASKDL